MSANDTTSKTTRAGALKRLALAAGGVAGIGLVGRKAFADDDPANVAAAALPLKRTRNQTVRIYGTSWSLAAPGVAPGELPAASDARVPQGTLVDKRGRELGSFRAAALLGTGSPVQLHTFDLADGTILGIGSDGVHENPFAIVGGTGRYAGVSGTYVAKQSPRELGGDGTAEFTLTLTA
jgi:hypothetical protein